MKIVRLFVCHLVFLPLFLAAFRPHDSPAFIEADGYYWWKLRTGDGAEGWAVDVAGWYHQV